MLHIVLLQISKSINQWFNENYYLRLRKMHCTVVSSLHYLCQCFSLFLTPSWSDLLSSFERSICYFDNILMLGYCHWSLIWYFPLDRITTSRRSEALYLRSLCSLFFSFEFRIVWLFLLISHELQCIGIISGNLFTSILGIIFTVKLLLSHKRYYKRKWSYFLLVSLQFLLWENWLTLLQNLFEVLEIYLSQLWLLYCFEHRSL